MKLQRIALLPLVAILAGLNTSQGQEAEDCAKYYKHTAAGDWSCSQLAVAYQIQLTALQQLNPWLNCSRPIPRDILTCVRGVPAGTLTAAPSVDTSESLLLAPSPSPVTLPTPSPSPAAAAGSNGGCSVQLKRWDQCGGSICSAAVQALQPRGVCADGPWAGHCCPAQHTCKRSQATYYQCRPDAPAELLLSVPSHYVKVGQPTTVTARLTQAGEPLRYQPVTISLTDDASAAVTTYTATTDADGVARTPVKASLVPVTYSISASSGTGEDEVSGTWASTDDRTDVTWVKEQLLLRILSNSSTAVSDSSGLLILAPNQPAYAQVNYTMNDQSQSGAVVTVALAVPGATGSVVQTATARTDASGSATVALTGSPAFYNQPLVVNATTPSVLETEVIMASSASTTASATAKAIHTVAWSTAGLPNSPSPSPIVTPAQIIPPSPSPPAAVASPLPAITPVTDTPVVNSKPVTKSVTMPLARVEVTVSGSCSPEVETALETSVKDAVVARLAAAAVPRAAAAAVAEKVVVNSTCSGGGASSDTGLRRRLARLLLQGTPAAAAAAESTYSVSVRPADSVTDGASLQLMLDTFSAFVDDVNMGGLESAVPAAAAAMTTASADTDTALRASAVFGYEVREVTPAAPVSPSPSPAAVLPPPRSPAAAAAAASPSPSPIAVLPPSRSPAAAAASPSPSPAAAAVLSPSPSPLPSPSPSPAAAAAAAPKTIKVNRPSMKFTATTSGSGCSDAVSEALIAGFKKQLTPEQADVVEVILMGCTENPAKGVAPTAAVPEPLFAYYVYEVIVSDTVTDTTLLSELTDTFTKLSATVKDAASLESAAPGISAAVAAASKNKAKLVNSSAEIKSEEIEVPNPAAAASAVSLSPETSDEDLKAAAAASPSPSPSPVMQFASSSAAAPGARIAALPYPSPSPSPAAAAAGIRTVEITRPTVILTIITTGRVGCDVYVSDVLVNTVEDQIPRDLRSDVTVAEAACTEAQNARGATDATYIIEAQTSETLTNATRLSALMTTFSTLSDDVNSSGLEAVIPGTSAAVAAASDDMAKLERAEATLDMKTLTVQLPAAAAAAAAATKPTIPPPPKPAPVTVAAVVLPLASPSPSPAAAVRSPSPAAAAALVRSPSPSPRPLQQPVTMVIGSSSSSSPKPSPSPAPYDYYDYSR